MLLRSTVDCSSSFLLSLSCLLKNILRQVMQVIQRVNIRKSAQRKQEYITGFLFFSSKENVEASREMKSFPKRRKLRDNGI